MTHTAATLTARLADIDSRLVLLEVRAAVNPHLAPVLAMALRARRSTVDAIRAAETLEGLIGGDGCAEYWAGSAGSSVRHSRKQTITVRHPRPVVSAEEAALNIARACQVAAEMNWD